MAFSFGTNPTSSAGGTGLTFGTPATTSAFGAPSAAPAFGMGTSTAPSAFGIGTSTAPTAFGIGTSTAPTAFGIGTSTAPTAFGIGTSTAPTAFGINTSTAPTAFGSGFGTSFGTSTNAAPSLNLSTTGTGFGVAQAATPAPALGSFSFSSAPGAGSTSFANPKPATTAAGIAPTSTTSAFGSTALGGSVSSTGGFGFPPANPSGAPTGAPAAGCVASATQGSMTFEELEKKCNEWKKELEFQEEAFLKRATQINAWDRLITANAEKITELHEYMKKVKSDQDRMDREVDFVVAQQKELEEMLGPLEQEALALEPTSIQHHTDFERQTTYNSATTVNAQLRGMAERIKEIIEHINANNKSGNDSSSISQITKILNAHVDVLQFIQNGIDTLQQKTEDVNKLMASGRI